MLAAVKAQVPFRINGRRVAVDDKKTTVSLCDKAIATLSFKNRTISINGDTPVTRKSARVINTILREFTEFWICSIDGQWVVSDPQGLCVPVGQENICLPMKRQETIQFR